MKLEKHSSDQTTKLKKNNFVFDEEHRSNIIFCHMVHQKACLVKSTVILQIFGVLKVRFKKKKKKKNSCRDWSSELCCSRKKVVHVEPMGKTSLVLDMVDVQEHDSG